MAAKRASGSSRSRAPTSASRMEAVAEGVGVDVDGGGCGYHVAEGVQPGSEGFDQVGFVAGVVLEEAGYRASGFVASGCYQVSEFQDESFHVDVGQAGDSG